MKKCEWFGHKWDVVVLKGLFGDKEIKLLGAYCKRCRKGHKEILDTALSFDKRIYATYNLKYFDIKELK